MWRWLSNSIYQIKVECNCQCLYGKFHGYHKTSYYTEKCLNEKGELQENNVYECFVSEDC